MLVELEKGKTRWVFQLMLNLGIYILYWIENMHKKRESPLLKSFKNPNAFKKKGNKLLKSLSPIPNYSIQSPSHKG